VRALYQQAKLAGYNVRHISLQYHAFRSNTYFIGRPFRPRNQQIRLELALSYPGAPTFLRRRIWHHSCRSACCRPQCYGWYAHYLIYCPDAYLDWYWNALLDHLWYVNAYPVDGIEFGLNNLSSIYFGGPPALVLTGPNQGANLGVETLISGTVGAAIAAAKAGIPAIAFSGSSGSPHSYSELQAGDYSFVYAGAALRLTQALLAAGPPYLPANTILNVNFPNAGPGTDCETVASVKFVLSRVYDALGLPIDAKSCGSKSLPSETKVVGTAGCYASVSLLKTYETSWIKLDASNSEQQQVLNKIGSFLSCLPA
jgi:hypothetical protein